MQSRTQLLTPSALRLDSRLPLELRSLSFEILPSPPSTSSSSIGGGGGGPPAHADGYALASHGLTTVASSVFGPREAQRTGHWSGGAGAGTGAGGGGGGGATAGGAQKGDKAQVNVEVGIAAWAERVGQGAATEGGVRRAGKDRSACAPLYHTLRQRLNPDPGRRTIEIAAAVKNTFEPVLLLHLYPRSSIDIYLQILENDGCELVDTACSSPRDSEIVCLSCHETEAANGFQRKGPPGGGGRRPAGSLASAEVRARRACGSYTHKTRK